MNFSRSHSIRFMLGLILTFCCANLFAEADKYTPPYKIYFYNPESNINNFHSLKVKFDSYLSQFGAFEFQPFDKKETFEKMLQETDDGIFLLSSWHYQFLIKNNSLKPVLVAIANGKITQRKTLSSTSDLQRLEDLRGKSITTAGSKQYSKNRLREIFSDYPQELLDSIKLVRVPTDMDALSSIKYGMSAAALSSEASLKKLNGIYPKLYAQLRTLGTSKQKFLALVVIKGHHEKAQQLLNILQKMSQTVDGRNKLHMLGLEGWRMLTEPELKLLNVQAGGE
ncbi:MAG: hypothetical protein GQ569_10690 [Methylococcaceae bacterium]|nr:hypothetical protein [Methylococcaceae bacterium]